MPIDTVKSEYSDMLPRVTTVRDCVAGESQVKSKTTTYLPDFDPSDTKRYNKYIMRARFTNYTGRTRNGFVGMVNRKDHVIEVPAQLEYLIDNCDGAGKSLKELVTDIVSELQVAGNTNYLVDYSDINENASMEDVRLSGARVSLKEYPFESRINWRLTATEGQVKANMIVLKETAENVDAFDMFKSESVTQYRVLMLDESGNYFQMVFDEDGKPTGEPKYPKHNREFWKDITFVSIGSESNDFALDKPVLEDIAYLNIGHYLNSADYEESCHFSGQGLLLIDIGDMSSQQFDEVNPSGITFGARRGLAGPGFKGQLLQMSDNSMTIEAMSKKEEQMRMIAAKMITDKSGNETAEAARIYAASETSQLTTLVENAEIALTEMLKMAALYEGANPDEVVVQLNKDFYPVTVSPQEIVVGIQLFDRGVIDTEDLRWKLKKAEMIDGDRSDDERTDDSQGINE